MLGTMGREIHLTRAMLGFRRIGIIAQKMIFRMEPQIRAIPQKWVTSLFMGMTRMAMGKLGAMKLHIRPLSLDVTKKGALCGSEANGGRDRWLIITLRMCPQFMGRLEVVTRHRLAPVAPPPHLFRSHRQSRKGG